MPLEDVRRWTQDGYVRITPEEAARLYPYTTVHANSGVLVCYNCYHSVAFSKGENRRFLHSRGDELKECKDRIKNLSLNRQQYLKKTLTAPMRLRWDGTRCGLDIGLLPISRSELTMAERQHAEVHIMSDGRDHAAYSLEPSFLVPGSTKWIAVPSGVFGKIHLNIVPSSVRFPTWGMPYAAIDSHGTFFDENTGDRLPQYGDVVVNHNYYLLTRHWIACFDDSDIVITQQAGQIPYGWWLYRVRAKQMSPKAAAFFIDYHLLLTNTPTRLVPLWPPLIENDHLLDTNRAQLWMMVEGDAEVEGYPNGSDCVRTTIDDHQGHRIILVENIGRGVQIVWAARRSVLRYAYLRPLEESASINAAEVSVTDHMGRPVENVLKAPPAHGVLHIKADVEGKAQVYDAVGLLYEEKLEADKERRLMNLQYGHRVVIRQGCEICTEIIIEAKKKTSLDSISLPRWHGADVAFDRRHAWLISRMSQQSELYRRTIRALQKGRIPSDGFKALQKMMGENRHG